MKLNVALLLRVKRRILREPAQFVMGSFFASGGLAVEDGGDLARASIPNCGTAACIAGWTAALVRKKRPSAFVDRSWDAAMIAGEALGIDAGEQLNLFHVRYWPYKFIQAWNEATTLEARAQVAAARIDAFIAQHTTGDEGEVG